LNKTFKTRLQVANLPEIDNLLDILDKNYEKIPNYLKVIFNSLKYELENQPNHFVFQNWKEKMSVLIDDFPFEIEN
jgi:hypothetical protein